MNRKRERRISAGGIIFRNDAVLLVRYPDGEGGSYLVAPGGAVEDSENVVRAVIREAKEETDAVVRPGRVMVIEDLESRNVKMIKVWMLCEFLEGEVRLTEEAKREGIIEVAWYPKPQLHGECVYPAFLMEYDWDQLQSENWRVECLPTREARNL